MKKDRVTFEGPRKADMKKKWVRCYKCDSWTICKPFFNKGNKDNKFYNKDGSLHTCDKGYWATTKIVID